MDRQDFMDIVYSELHSDGDNNRANRIIEAADEYAESAQLSKDCISRQAAIDAIDEQIAQCNKALKSLELFMKDEYAVKVEKASLTAFRERLEYLPPAQPQRTGKWIKKHRHYGGFRSYTGFDAMGEQHTVTVDERTEYDDLYCSECGARSADNFLNFCPNCGAKMEGDAE